MFALYTSDLSKDDKSGIEKNKQQLVTAPNSSLFREIMESFMKTSNDKPPIIIENKEDNINITNYKEHEPHISRTFDSALESMRRTKLVESDVETNILPKQVEQTQSIPPQPSSILTTQPKKACRPPPLPKKFGQLCHCGQTNHNKYFTNNNSSLGSLPAVAYLSPLHLYDPITKKCLPTSRNRDMLLKDCHSQAYRHNHGIGNSTKGTCYYDDLVCDSKKNKCVCKPTLHLFYENNLTSFGCVPIGPQTSPDGRIICRPGSIYNVITKDCHKIFDVSDLQSGVSATEFSFVTIIFIWILLLFLIVFAKLRKLRTSNLYRNTPQSERRFHHGGASTNAGVSSSYRANRLVWLYPFPASRHHHRTPVDRFAQSGMVDESLNYNDTDFFLANGGNRRINDLLSDNNFTGSQQSLNNPPPKFEEIYPSCTPITTTVDETDNLRPPSIQDLPSYDEAMKLQVPDISKE